MASSFSDYLENELLDHFLKVGAYTQPTNLYVALYTADPTDAGGGTEVSGGSYARVNHNAWNTASGGSSTNDGAIEFPTATANWGTVTAVGLFDASSGGNLLVWGELTTDKAVNNGDTASFADEALSIALD
jgi:hypothetical protein